MVDVSSAIHYHTTNRDGKPVSFTLKEAVATVEKSAGKPLTQEQVDALNIFLLISDEESRLFYPRISRVRHPAKGPEA